MMLGAPSHPFFRSVCAISRIGATVEWGLVLDPQGGHNDASFCMRGHLNLAIGSISPH